jgi:hypothetical protein
MLHRSAGSMMNPMTSRHEVPIVNLGVPDRPEHQIFDLRLPQAGASNLGNADWPTAVLGISAGWRRDPHGTRNWLFEAGLSLGEIGQ